MKGLLRVYDDGETFKCKLNWASIKENYLNFYEDKKSTDPSSFINLSGCRVKQIFDQSYKINMIEITTLQNKPYRLTPDNNKDFNKWKDSLHEASQKFRDSYEGQQPAITPRASRKIIDSTYAPPSEASRNSIPNARVPSNRNVRKPSNNVDQRYPDRDHVIDKRGRNSEYTPEPSNGYRPRNSVNGPPRPNRERLGSSDSIVRGSNAQTPNKYYRKPSAGYNEKRDSNVSGIPGFRSSRAIETVKEDPMMSDEEIFETKPLEELRRKYPITDKTKRWSIAATDLVGKSNDELFLMLIQLNREKSHMEIWKETLEKFIDEIDEKLKERLSMQVVNELESNRVHYVDQLNNIEYLMNLAHPLISFMDSVVQMSDAYGGNNDAFHVVYHQAAPTGQEDFSSINFIRHNQEKEVAKLLGDNKTQLPSVYNTLTRDTGSDKENDAALILNLNNTEEFLERKTGLNDIITEISSQLDVLEPTKKDIEKFIHNIDEEPDLIFGKINGAVPSINSKGSIKSIKLLKDNEIKNNTSAFMPRRSTRKAPKSDMAPSIQRKENLKVPGTIGSRSQNASLRYGPQSPRDANDSFRINPDLGRRSFHSITANEVQPLRAEPLPVTPRSQKSRTLNTNLSDSIARSSSSRVQNQLRDLMRTDPYEEQRSPSPIYRAPSSIMGVPDVPNDGPLIKLNANLFQNPHGPKRPTIPNTAAAPPLSRTSMSESDLSFSPNRINQRLNLNQFVDDNKNWKNPGRDVHNSGISNNQSLNEDSDAELKADRLIQNLLSTPEKVNIGDRYRASITEEEQDDINGPKSRKMRQLVANESFGRLSKEDGGRQNQRESMLLNNSLLAQEASRKSRNLQKT